MNNIEKIKNKIRKYKIDKVFNNTELKDGKLVRVLLNGRILPEILVCDKNQEKEYAFIDELKGSIYCWTDKEKIEFDKYGRVVMKNPKLKFIQKNSSAGQYVVKISKINKSREANLR